MHRKDPVEAAKMLTRSKCRLGMPDDGFGSWPFIRYTDATMARVIVVHWGIRPVTICVGCRLRQVVLTRSLTAQNVGRLTLHVSPRGSIHESGLG